MNIDKTQIKKKIQQRNPNQSLRTSKKVKMQTLNVRYEQ